MAETDQEVDSGRIPTFRRVMANGWFSSIGAAHGGPDLIHPGWAVER